VVCGSPDSGSGITTGITNGQGGRFPRPLVFGRENRMEEIPYGYCHCGCGGKTTLIQKHAPRCNRIKGEPNKYLPEHRSFLSKTYICARCKVKPKEKRSYCLKCYSEQALERVRAWNGKNPDKRKELGIRALQKGRLELSDRYIKDLISKRTSLSFEDIPDELVHLYRKYVELRRIAKKTQLKGAENGQTDECN
jgi:hypothetical protein